MEKNLIFCFAVLFCSHTVFGAPTPTKNPGNVTQSGGILIMKKTLIETTTSKEIIITHDGTAQGMEIVKKAVRFEIPSNPSTHLPIEYAASENKPGKSLVSNNPMPELVYPNEREIKSGKSLVPNNPIPERQPSVRSHSVYPNVSENKPGKSLVSNNPIQEQQPSVRPVSVRSNANENKSGKSLVPNNPMSERQPSEKPVQSGQQPNLGLLNPNKVYVPSMASNGKPSLRSVSSEKNNPSESIKSNKTGQQGKPDLRRQLLDKKLLESSHPSGVGPSLRSQTVADKNQKNTEGIQKSDYPAKSSLLTPKPGMMQQFPDLKKFSDVNEKGALTLMNEKKE